MLILNLKGGLGNQIFQYIAAMRVASTKNKKLYIYLGNLKAFKTKRNFSLNVFIKNSPIEIVLIERNIFLNKYLLAILKKLNFLIITENNFFSKTNSSISIIDDYFINSKFLDSLLIDNLKESLYIQYPKLNKQYIDEEGLGIHIRGTDRIEDNQSVFFEDILYKALISENIVIYCFTDDINYAKSKLINIKNKIVFMTKYKLSDIEEFYLISQMNKFIVSNSTFSILARRMSSNHTSTYVVRDFFASRDKELLEVFNFESNIYYI